MVDEDFWRAHALLVQLKMEGCGRAWLISTRDKAHGGAPPMVDVDFRRAYALVGQPEMEGGGSAWLISA